MFLFFFLFFVCLCIDFPCVFFRKYFCLVFSLSLFALATFTPSSLLRRRLPFFPLSNLPSLGRGRDRRHVIRRARRHRHPRALVQIILLSLCIDNGAPVVGTGGQGRVELAENERGEFEDLRPLYHTIPIGVGQAGELLDLWVILIWERRR